MTTSRPSTVMEVLWMALALDLRKGRGMGWAFPLSSMLRQYSLYFAG